MAACNSQALTVERTEGAVAVHFAMVHKTRFAELCMRREEFLSAHEQIYFERLDVQRRKESYLLGRYAAKLSVVGFLGAANLNEIEIQRGVFEQPIVRCRIPNAPGVTLSHCDEMAVALAFPTGHPMGIDIEKINCDKAATMRSQATPRELRWINFGLDSMKDSLSAVGWTAKEALSKALRCGLMTPMETLALKEIREETGRDWEGLFENFAQYKALSSVRNGFVVSIVLPKRSQLKAPPYSGDLIQGRRDFS